MTNWFHSIDFQPPRLRAPSFAFSLVELLVVIAIIAMMVGLSAVAVQGFRAPAVRQAAEQAMSGLSLARQIAITKNTQAAFLIANQTNPGFPSEPFRHWSVVYSNRGSGTWTLAKDWEPLPNGAVFGELLGNSYSPLNKNPYALEVGKNITAAQFITSNTTFTVLKDTSSASPLISSTIIPHIRFMSDGSAFGGSEAIRIVPGSVMSGNATLTGNSSYYFIETDATIGRIRMRAPESYK
jgi:type II secretory pathway pseudopilin PulG